MNQCNFGHRGSSMWMGTALLAALMYCGVVNAAGPDVKKSEGEHKEFQLNRPQGAAAAEAQQPQQMVKASELVGKNITDGQDKKIGEIKDLAIDMRNSRLVYVVVSSGGILGIGDTLTAVPPQALGPYQKDGDLRLVTSSQDLKQLPTLEGKTWITAFDLNKVSDLYRRTGVEVPADLQDSKGLRRASELMGARVVSKHDESGGEVEDMAVDLKDGRVPYIVLSVGGFADLNAKLVAVPTPALSQGPEDDMMRVSVTGHELYRSPDIDQKNWEQTLADRNWGADLYLSYGFTPYWVQDVGGGDAPRATGGTRMPSAENIEDGSE